MIATTYSVRVRKGQIELPSSVDLPEGKDVFVIIPSASTLTEQQARRKANGWLIRYVGNMLMAGDGSILQKGPGWYWSFPVYITSSSHEPWGPISTILIETETGQVAEPHATKITLMESSREFTRPL